MDMMNWSFPNDVLHICSWLSVMYTLLHKSINDETLRLFIHGKKKQETEKTINVIIWIAKIFFVLNSLL